MKQLSDADPHRRVRPLAVVVVTYQSAGVVEGCLTALPEALAGAGETRVVVVDNASTDGTREVVARVAPDARVIARSGNDGFAAGVNAGIAASPGCDVLVLNADIRLAPGSVALLRSAVTQRVGVVAPALVDGDGVPQRSLRRSPTVLRTLAEALLGGTRAGRSRLLGETVTDPKAYREPGEADWVTGAAWLVTRECLTVLGALDDRYLLYSEETEFMLRARRGGFAVRYEPAAKAVHLGGELESSAPLWSLMVANKVRLHRQRFGLAAAVPMWFAVALNELLRSVRGDAASKARHRTALRGLVGMSRWPAPLGGAKAVDGEPPSYLCFSAQDWWYHNRAHSDFQLLTRVAEQRKVLLVNSIGLRMPLPGRSTQFLRRILRKAKSVAMLVRKPLPNVPGFHVMTPLPLPFYGKPWLRKLNSVLVRAQVRAVCAYLRMGSPVVVATIPTAWDVVEPMKRKALLFNRSDRHSAFPESDQKTIAALEDELLAHSDHVLYVSRALQDQEHAATGDRSYFLDHGVDLEHFQRRAERPADLAGIAGPIIGFFGSLDDYLVDFDLLEHVAASLPDASLVLIGDATCSMERFAKYPNVHWLGFKPYEEIPAYGTAFDVALMPWLDNDWIKHANPIKLKEYLALGLPIVTTDFPEIDHYTDRVRIAKDRDGFVELIETSLADGGLVSPEQLRESVLPASWDSRAQQLVDLAEGGRPCAG